MFFLEIEKNDGCKMIYISMCDLLFITFGIIYNVLFKYPRVNFDLCIYNLFFIPIFL